VWTRRWLDEIVQDVRYALRTLRKSPGFTTIAVLTIALGIGANTAIFSLVNGAILRPLDYPEPERLMFLTTSVGQRGTLSPAEYWEFTELNQSFSAVGAFVTGDVNLSAGDRPRRTTRASVNAELLEALAVAGRARPVVPSRRDARRWSCARHPVARAVAVGLRCA
jgi:hypothetical protein